MFGVDRAFFGDHIPCAISALVCFNNLAMGFDGRPTHTRGLGIGMRGTRRVKMAVQRIVKRADDAIQIGDRGDFGDFLGPDDFCFQSHVPMLGAFRQQHVKAFFVIS